jgi:hypothetical protein
VHRFLTGLHVISHFWENGRWITKDKKIDFVFWRFFKIIIWRPILKFCSLEDNHMTYPKSIGSLGLCHTDAKISERKVSPWPCNNFAGQCIYNSFTYCVYLQGKAKLSFVEIGIKSIMFCLAQVWDWFELMLHTDNRANGGPYPIYKSQFDYA